jgi:hypothetical protein
MLAQHEPDVPIKSSPAQAGWAVSGKTERVLFNGQGKKKKQGYVLQYDAIKHREFKAKRGKKANKRPVDPTVYPNDKLSPWQLDMARYIHAGHNVVADVVTSCGKTWAANLITAWEVLAKDTSAGAQATGLIIAPNTEVMRDSVKDICEHHSKEYAYAGKVMIRTLTRNFTTYDEKFPPAAQIMVVSVECIEEFITDPINAKFVDNLRIIVFDEVHLKGVTRGLWWSQYIPHTAQLVLLSATLGDPESVKQTVEQIQSLQEYRPRETKIIKYNVRPIALQPLLFKECDTPSNGVFSKELKKGKKLSCVINQFDPTVRDITSLLGPDAVIPDTREEQFAMGQLVIAEHTKTISTKLDEALKTAQVEPTPSNIYTLLAYLFANEKQPVMVFNTTAGTTEDLARKLVSHISQLESKDPDYIAAEKQQRVYEKECHRSRDKKDDRGPDRNKTNDKKSKSKSHDPENRNKDERDAPIKERTETINIHDMNSKLSRWKFPSTADIPDNIPQWIRDCLEYGIGIYVSTMKVWQRHIMFDAFRDGKIQVLLSDSTISVGINLPIRTVVMCGRIPHPLYKQASGRAGRRGMDTEGCIVHMMPKEDIKHCLTTRVPEVHIDMPASMNHADLIRVLVPSNLDTYYVGGEEKFQRAEAVSPYKTEILNNYLATLSPENSKLCLNQIDLLRKEHWHYHRLTNLIKTLPEAGSIILMKFLVKGDLTKMSKVELIDMISVLFYRVELPHDKELESEPDYYLPVFEGRRLELLQKFADAYGVGINFSRPVHRYFSDFCRKQIVHLDRISELLEIGEWLYILKRGVTSVTPSTRVKTPLKDKKGKSIYRVVHSDVFAKTLVQLDCDYLAARVHCSV